jgi:ubiquinone/menaquinone biosynthesis C-methylase UbiE
MPAEQIAAFTNVDDTADPDFFLRFLKRGNSLESIKQAKPIILDGLRLQDGQHVLDVGCGTGEDVIELAGRVRPSGQVTGIDISHAMIDEARRRTPREAHQVRYETADVQALPFADHCFDACRVERVLMHVPDPQLAIAEIVRVTKPGGRICIFDFDWDTHIVDSPYRATSRAVVRSFTDGIRNGWIARQLPRLLSDHDVSDIRHPAHTVFLDEPFYELLLSGHLEVAQRAGNLDPEKLRRWWDHLRSASEAGTFLAAVTALIVSGTRA